MTVTGNIKNIIEYKYSFGLGIIGNKYLYKYIIIKYTKLGI